VTTPASPIAPSSIESAWDIGNSGSMAYPINEMHKKKRGADLDDTAGRAMQGLFVLADAINPSSVKSEWD